MIAKNFENKEVHKISHVNKAKEENEKIEVVKLDRYEDKILKCNMCKKF